MIEATVRGIASHSVLISEVIQQLNCRVVDFPGDNIKLDRIEDARIHAAELLRLYPGYTLELDSRMSFLQIKRPRSRIWKIYVRLGYLRDDNESGS